MVGLCDGVLMRLSTSSLKHLEGVHPDLQAVVRQAAMDTDLDFIVTEGVRTLMRQSELVAKGASSTMKSRHLTGHAVDLAAMIGNEVRWDWPLYHRLAKTMKQAAAKLNVPLEAGADWKKFPDGPHFQLPWKEYP